MLSCRGVIFFFHTVGVRHNSSEKLNFPHFFLEIFPFFFLEIFPVCSLLFICTVCLIIIGSGNYLIIGTSAILINSKAEPCHVNELPIPLVCQKRVKRALRAHQALTRLLPCYPRLVGVRMEGYCTKRAVRDAEGGARTLGANEKGLSHGPLDTIHPLDVFRP